MVHVLENLKPKQEKLIFQLNKLPKWKLKDDELIMMTIRSHDQFNTTIYGLNDRYQRYF